MLSYFKCAVFLLFFLPLFSWSQVECKVVAEKVDFHREWGVQILKDNDPGFKTDEYQKSLQEASIPATVGFYRWGVLRTPMIELYERYKEYFSMTDGVHSLEVLRFTNSGTDANNALYEFAEYAYRERTGKKAKRANLLFFGNPYGGSFGRSAEIGVRYKMDPKVARKFQIPTPTSNVLNPEDPAEIQRLEKLETEALEFIRQQVAKNSLEIGGIFLEPISVTQGLNFFRASFLIKLRALADELRVPIMADEIFTGGGRTGRFWAVQHYKDFRPDLMTFGKGLGVSGVAKYSRFSRTVKESRNGFNRMTYQWIWPSFDSAVYSNKSYTYPETALDNTSRVHPLALVQSLAILVRIQEAKLYENAESVGLYALAKMREKAQRLGISPDEIQGIGLLFNVGVHTDALVGRDRVIHYNGRWAPPITTTKEEFDKLLSAESN